MRRLALFLSIALIEPLQARAHDFWIEPSTFRPARGSNVALTLRVGQNFAGDAVPRTSALIERFVVRDASGEKAIGGLEDQDPAGWLRVDGRSAAVVGYRSRPSYVELPADRFEEYLRQEGLERIIDQRTMRRERKTPGREQFSRCAKALLSSERHSSAVTRPLGFRYEIVPSVDPTVARGPFRGRVLFEGKPLRGALVTALLQSDPTVRLTIRSDGGGAFTFHLPRGGVWLIESVQMIDAPRGSAAEWESLWASLTFETAGSPATTGQRSSR